MIKRSIIARWGALAAGRPGNPWWAPGFLGAAAAGLLAAVPVPAAGELAKRDCAPQVVGVDEGDELLTREERIARLEQAFEASLARFEACLNDSGTYSASGAGSGSGGGGAGVGAGGSGAGSGGGGQGGQSGQAAASIAGSQPESEPAEAEAGEDAAAESEAADAAEDSETSAPEKELAAGSPAEDAADSKDPDQESAASGAIPEDIPPGDNDSVLEQLIRAEAMQEKDPKAREKLWNEYRAYKGLPQKPVSSEPEEEE